MTSTTEDLYKEVPCKRCGQKMLAIASFCPHCGEIVSEGWFERVLRRFRSDDGGIGLANMLPVLVGLVVAGYFLYTAIEQGSIQGYILAFFSLLFAFRALFSGSRQSGRVNSEGQPTIHDADEPPDDTPADKFFCENCGTEVPGESTECPKCGMKFG